MKTDLYLPKSGCKNESGVPSYLTHGVYSHAL